MQFISLHNHSHYSILKALPSPKDLLLRAKELGQSALALTDHYSFAGIWEAFKISKEIGIKLIVGAEFHFLSDANKKDDKLRHIILLAKNATGYRNLLSMNRLGYDNPVLAGKKIIPVIDWQLLQKYSDGVICLTSCGNGIISQHINAKNFDAAITDLKRLVEIFGKDNLGVEVQSHALNRPATHYNGSINQVFTNYHLIKLAQQFDLRVVPTCNTHYLKKEHAGIHDVLLAIGAMQPVYSNARLKYNVPDFYLKSGEEMQTFFSRNFGDEFATNICANTIYFADKCEVAEWIDPKHSNLAGKELPEFDVKQTEDYAVFTSWLSSQDENIRSLNSDDAFLRFKCYEIFSQKYKHHLSLFKQAEYIERLEKELMVLKKQGFSSYMLIVADYVNWAKRNSAVYSFGRGSIGGSYVAYLLGIHAADPIRYGLIFERFQNIEKTSYPDADCDFSAADREKVIQYIHRKYGIDKVAFVSNFSRITPKVYARDIARSLEFGNNRQEAVNIGDQIADSISKDVKNSINFNDLRTSPLFMEYVKHHPELIQNAAILGKIRNTATHAAALVIGRRPLNGLVPLRTDKDGHQTLEHEKNNAEASGLVKMDILGLSTLDLIESTFSIINRGKDTHMTMGDIKFEEYDKKTYDLISRGDTFGVFQFGTSGGTIELCKKIKPRSIEDLAIITTLARPAAAAIREEFIKTREGKQQFTPIHPSLHNAFQKTYGFALYDESILQLGQDVAGWSLNEADRLRKMIKEKGKYPDKDKKVKEDFITGAVLNGIEHSIAVKIWNENVATMGSYTFNKSHAVLYSFLSYVTAYLKAHFPVEFLLAHLMADIKSNAPDAKLNVDRAKSELRAHNVKILPPNINQSYMAYHLLDTHTLLTGLDALKFVGDDAIQDIIEKRPFKDFDDFMQRVETKKVRSSAVQALAASGCIDHFGIPRKLIYLYCQDYRKKLQVWLKKHDPITEKFTYPWKQEPDWSKPELYALENNYLGEAFVCSKKEAFGNFFLSKEHANVTVINASKNRTFLPSVKAEIKSVFELKVKKEGSRFLGQEMLKVTIEDEDGIQCGVTVFPEQWQRIKQQLKTHKNKWAFEPGYAIHFVGTCNMYDNQMGVILDTLCEIAPPPSVPKDLKAKKISIKDKVPEVAGQVSDLISEIENELILEGLVDLDNDPLSDDI